MNGRRPSSRTLLIALSIAAGATSSCAEPPRAHGPDPARIAPPRDTLLDEPFDVTGIATHLAISRGRSLHAPVQVETLDEAEIAGHLQQDPGEDAFWHGFGLAAPNDNVSARLPALHSKQIAGLYDRRAKIVWVRRRGERPEHTRAWTLVHEIAHAMQEQALFGMSPPRNADELLARRALIEGDAELTTAVFVASVRKATEHRLASFLSEAGVTPSRGSPSSDAPAFALSEWSFPYVDGVRFVGALFRAGGYALVDRLFEYPPTSTEQVLHVDRYLAGDSPVPVKTPVAPEGWSRVTADTMGELRTRSLLVQSGVLDPGDGSPLGWGGDAYAIVANTSGKLAVLWSTVWDDEPSASRFEHLMGVRESTRQRATRTPPTDEVTLLLDGVRVAYVQGLTPDLRPAIARGLLALPEAKPPSAPPPIGDVRQRPLVDPESFIGKGGARGDHYVSERLGLTVPTRGFDVVATTTRDELTLQAYFGFSAVRIDFLAILSPWSAELEDRLAWEVVGGFESAGVPVTYLGESPVTTDAGPGRALRWSRGAGTNWALVLLPVCDGEITIVAVADGGGSGIWDEIRGAVRHVHFDEASPACRFVKEDRL